MTKFMSGLQQNWEADSRRALILHDVHVHKVHKRGSWLQQYRRDKRGNGHCAVCRFLNTVYSVLGRDLLLGFSFSELGIMTSVTIYGS
jgi:hypothetical protein